MKAIFISENVNYDTKTKCFFIEKNDGKIEEISYLKCIQNLNASIFKKNKFSCFLNENEKFDSILKLIAKILKVFPLFKDVFIKILSETFPHRRVNEDILSIFFFRILKLTIVIIFNYKKK